MWIWRCSIFLSVSPLKVFLFSLFILIMNALLDIKVSRSNLRPYRAITANSNRLPYSVGGQADLPVLLCGRHPLPRPLQPLPHRLLPLRVGLQAVLVNIWQLDLASRTWNVCLILYIECTISVLKCQLFGSVFRFHIQWQYFEKLESRWLHADTRFHPLILATDFPTDPEHFSYPVSFPLSINSLLSKKKFAKPF